MPSAFDGPNVTTRVDFACGSLVRERVVRDNIDDVLGPHHHTLATLEAPDWTQQAAFAPDRRQARFALGIHHILSGCDRRLFLVRLLRPGGGLLSLTAIIAAFRIAHRVTLSLAMRLVVVRPDRLVEAMIARSIAFVAAENLVRSRPWLVGFCFWRRLLFSLLGFSRGVEVGQGLVVAVCPPLLFLLRRTRWESRAVLSSSLVSPARGPGLVLFVERALR